MNRVFVVGCSRSGTTLIQSRLALHSSATSFPETQFFVKLLRTRKARLLEKLDYAPRTYQRSLLRLREILPGDLVDDAFEGRTGSFKALVEGYVTLLDSIAQARNRTTWIEKSPRHCFHVRTIQKRIPDAKFLHVLRDGREVAASIRGRALRWPEQFGKQHTPDYAIRLWNRAVQVSADCIRRPGHLLVFYEDFVTQPQIELCRICDFLRLDFEADMLETDGGTVDCIVEAHEGWKANAMRQITLTARRFQRSFTDEEQAYLRERLNLPLFEHLRASSGGNA